MPPGSSENFEYKNPQENLERGEDPMHTIDLVLDGKSIGRAEMSYRSKPFPLYQLDDLYVDYEYQGAGRASEIMAQVEAFPRSC